MQRGHTAENRAAESNVGNRAAGSATDDLWAGCVATATSSNRGATARHFGSDRCCNGHHCRILYLCTRKNSILNKLTYISFGKHQIYRQKQRTENHS